MSTVIKTPEKGAPLRAGSGLLTLHFEVSSRVPIASEVVFAYLDDFTRLGSHMSRSSWMMAGSRMRYEFDAGGGRTIGSVVGLRGKVLGIPLLIDEVVTERVPGVKKAWETLEGARMLVLQAYRIGFQLDPDPAGCRLTVYIDYSLPRHGVSRWLGALFGHAYSRWCVRVMVRDVVRQFGL